MRYEPRRAALPEAGNATRTDTDQQSNPGESQNQTQQATRQRENQALGEQLPDDLAAAGAESRPRGELTLPGRGPRQQKIGYVRAGDQQHEADSSEQNHKWEASIADDRLLERNHTETILGRK